jgi:hypothetical protein
LIEKSNRITELNTKLQLFKPANLDKIPILPKSTPESSEGPYIQTPDQNLIIHKQLRKMSVLKTENQSLVISI